MSFTTRISGSIASLTVAQAVYAACQWGMISVLARLGSPEIVGKYALGVAVSAPILMLVPNRRTQSQTACSADIRIMSLVFAMLGIAAVGFLNHSLQDQAAVAIVVMAQSVEGIAAIYSGRHNNAISLLLHGALPVIVLGILTASTGRTSTGLLGVLIARLLVLILYDLRRPARESVQDASQDNSPAIPLAFVGSVPCYFVVHILGYRWLGIFAALASLPPVVGALVCALGQAATPQLASLYREGDRPAFRRLTVQLISVGLILGLCTVAGSILAGSSLLGLLFGPDYAAESALLLGLAAAGGLGFATSLLGSVLSAGRHFHEEIPLEIAAVAAVSLASVALVPRVGIAGAAGAAPPSGTWSGLPASCGCYAPSSACTASPFCWRY